MRLSLETLAIRLTTAAICAFSTTQLNAGQSTLHVPRDYPTIQQAVTAANPGTRILVERGRYEGTLWFHNARNVTLIGQRGVTVLPSPGYTYAVKIEDSQNISIRGLKLLAGVFAEDSQEVSLEQLKLEEARFSGLLALRCDDLTVKRCSFRSTGAASVHISDSARALVTQNRIWDSPSHGIAIDGGLLGASPDARIERNRIYGVANCGIRVTSPNSTVSRNKVTGCRNGLYLEGGFALVERNKVSGSSRDAMILGGDGNTVLKNAVRRSQEGGIYISGDQGTANNNQVKACQEYGFWLSCSDATFERNKVSSTGTHGLWLLGDRNLVSRSKINKVGQMGVRVDGDDNHLARNKAKRSLAYDISDTGDDNTYVANHFGTYDPDNPPN